MKKIINGIRYDSEKATEIGTMESGHGFEWCKCTLYVTPKSNRFFITGHGGPMTRFAQSAGQNSFTNGSDLIPFDDKQEALKWAENHLDPDVFEPFFIDLIEDA